MDDGDNMDVEHDPAADMVAMVDCLQTLGVEPEIATRYAATIVKRAQSSRPLTFYEAYGTGNMVHAASHNMRNLNIKGLAALDIRTVRPDGKPWDFTKRSHRRLAYRTVRDNNPDWLVGCPPCTPFCTWHTGLNAQRMDPKARSKALKDGRMHSRLDGMWRENCTAKRCKPIYYVVKNHASTKLVAKGYAKI